MQEQERLIDFPEVARMTRLSKSSLYRRMREGVFPLPLKAGPKAVRWKASEILGWIESLPRATGDLAD